MQRIALVCLVCLVYWLNETNQMNQINQINKTNQISQMNQIILPSGTRTRGSSPCTDGGKMACGECGRVHRSSTTALSGGSGICLVVAGASTRTWRSSASLPTLWDGTGGAPRVANRKSPDETAPPELASVCFAQHLRHLSNRNHDGQGIDGRGDKPASLIETFRCR